MDKREKESCKLTTELCKKDPVKWGKDRKVKQGEHCGMLVCHLLQDMNVPKSNLDKD